MKPWHVNGGHCSKCRQVTHGPEEEISHCSNCGSRRLSLIIQVYSDGGFATMPSFRGRFIRAAFAQAERLGLSSLPWE